jgi:thiosulfate reductase cytochrome b subunit
MHGSSVEPVRGAQVKSAIQKATVAATLALTMLLVTASPAVAGTGATLAEAKPWHYWIAYVLVFSALGIVLIALPVGYYLRVYRLKHPRAK